MPSRQENSFSLKVKVHYLHMQTAWLLIPNANSNRLKQTIHNLPICSHLIQRKINVLSINNCKITDVELHHQVSIGDKVQYFHAQTAWLPIKMVRNLILQIQLIVTPWNPASKHTIHNLHLLYGWLHLPARDCLLCFCNLDVIFRPHNKLVRSRWLDICLVHFFAFLYLASIQPSWPRAWSITHISNPKKNKSFTSSQFLGNYPWI